MRRYDVIVVGAGLAGCAAAYDLAYTGHSVLLIDKQEFLRHKACGGGLTVKTVQALRYSIDPDIRQVCKSLRVGKGTSECAVFLSRAPICAMTVRAELDQFCLTMTRAVGAKFILAKWFNGFEESEAGVIIQTSKGEFRAAFLIGVDGANSQVRRLMGNASWITHGLAIEGRIINSEPSHEMEFNFGVFEGGYGWVFPKRDHLNLGIYTSFANVRLSKENLRLHAAKKLRSAELIDIVGHQVPLENSSYRPTTRSVFRDAAGLVDPPMEEGIFNAIKSGQAAAYAIHGQFLKHRSSARKTRS